MTQVKLVTGEYIWVNPEYFTIEPTEPRDPRKVEVVNEVQDQELGSDEEREDMAREDGEVEGSEINRHVRSEVDAHGDH